MSAACLLAPEPPVIVRCSCGRAYTETTWAALHLVGHCDSETGEVVTPFALAFRRRMGGELRVYEMRNCVCRSTITRAL